MSGGEVQSAPAAGRPARVVMLKSASWVILVLLLAFAAAWLIKSIQCNSALRERAQRSAQNIADAIAAFGSEDIEARNYEGLQSYSDELVRSRPIAFVAIIDSRGRIVVHTNREFLGKRPRDLRSSGDVVDASSRATGLSQQSSTVIVGVRLR
jgi:sensor histidine kinase regulating citrate/malate metabolism